MMYCEENPFSEFLEDLGIDSEGVKNDILDSLEEEENEQETDTTE